MAASKTFAAALLFLWQIVLARTLGAERYGVYGTIGALMAVGAAVPDLGMGIIVIREVARRPDRAGSYLAGTLVLQPALAVTGYAALQLAAWLLGYGTEIQLLLAFVGISLLVDAVGTMGHNLFIAAEQMSWPALVGVGHVILLAALGVAALVSGGGLWGVYVAMLTAGLARAGAYWIGLVRRGWRPVFPADRELVGRLVTGGAPLAAAALLSLAFMHSDKLLTTAIVGTEATGQLTAAFIVVFGVVELLGSTVLVALLPIMARAHDDTDRSVLDGLLARLVSLEMLLGLPAAAILSFGSGPIARMVFGARFDRTADVLGVLAWYVLASMIAGAVAQALTVRNRQSRVLAARAGALAINLAVTLALLPRVGIIGAAAGMLVGEVAVVATLLILLGPTREWWARVGRRTLRLAPAAVALLISCMVLPQVPVVARMGAGLACYAALATATGAFAREDYAMLVGAFWQGPRRGWRRRTRALHGDAR